MEYRIVTEAAERLRQDQWHVQVVARSEGYPIYRFARRPPTAHAGGVPSLLITAGIHGEEPAAVVGLVQWLRQRAAAWTQRLSVVVFPCLNPWGFERGVRYASDGLDLNRQFDAPKNPAVLAFNRFLDEAGPGFDLFVDLHEDCDFKAMYLYELIHPAPAPGDPPTLGRRILQRASERVALHTGPVETLRARDGIIENFMDPEAARTFTQTPIAVHAFGRCVSHVVTVETPGLLSLDVRAAVHVDALDEACRFLLE